MKKHLVLISASEAEEILSGKSEYLLRFFRKRPDFFKVLASGDLIYFRKKGSEVLGQFLVGKLLVVEGIGKGDWEWIEKVISDQWKGKREEFIEKANENSTLVIIQIEELEQFITSPIDVPKNSRKEWIVLD